jgi:hypothetical protein
MQISKCSRKFKSRGFVVRTMLERVKGDGSSRWGSIQSHHKTKDKALGLSGLQFLGL